MATQPVRSDDEAEEETLIALLDDLDKRRNSVQQRLREVRNRMGRNKQSMVSWPGVHPRVDGINYKYQGEQK
ncbi:MAG: hypothetical protein [Caudoviricetes sp.]|nr:MAG: hypothetical protein [Caudoviricetes sp.]